MWKIVTNTVSWLILGLGCWLVISPYAHWSSANASYSPVEPQDILRIVMIFLGIPINIVALLIFNHKYKQEPDFTNLVGLIVAFIPIMLIVVLSIAGHSTDVGR